MTEFIIPIHTEDLELKKPDRFYVHTVLELDDSSSEVDGIIEGLNDSLLNDREIVNSVLDHAVFDNIYSLIKAWTILGATQKSRIIEILCSAVQDLLVSLAAPPPAAVFADPIDAKRLASRQRNAFKALLYIFAIAVQVAEKTGAPVSILKAAGGKADAAGKSKRGGKAGGRGKKAAAAAKEEEADEAAEAREDEGGEGAALKEEEEEGFEWAAVRESAVLLLAKAANETDFRRLWPQGVPEEEFVAVFTKTGLRLLNSPVAMKDKAARAAVVLLVAATTARFPALVTSTTVALVAAVTTHDHAAAVAADVAVVWGSPAPRAPHGAGDEGDEEEAAAASRPLCGGAAAELLRELGRVGGAGTGGPASSDSSSSASKDSGGLRRAAALVVDVSSRLPSLVLSNVSVLLPFLEADAYTLRSAIVTALGNIVGSVFNSARMAAAAAPAPGGEALEGAYLPLASGAPSAASLLMSESTRDTLLDTLQARALDVHSLTRACVLKAWLALLEASAVPHSRLAAVTELATARLQDKGAMVRRAACGLLRGLLEYNPFGGRADPEWFGAQVGAAEAWLGEHAPALLARLKQADGAAPAQGGTGDASGPQKQQQQQGAGKKRGTGAGRSKRGLQPVDEEGGDDDDEEGGGGGGDLDSGGDLDEAVLAESAAALEAESNGDAAPGAQDAFTTTPEMAAYVRHRELCAAGRVFALAIAACVPAVAALMSSKTGSDVKEAIRTLSRARSFGVPGAGAALARMLVLVWSQEPGVKEEVIDTFDKLYILNEALEEVPGGAEEEGEGAPAVKAAPSAEAADPALASGAPARRPRRASKTASARQPKAKRAALDPGAGGDGEEDSGAEEEDDDEDAEEEEDEEEDAPKARRLKARSSSTAAPRGRGAASRPRASAARRPSSASAASKKASASTSASSSVSSSSGGLSAAAARTAKQRSGQLDAPLITANLIGLLQGASLAVRTSLEEVLKEATARGLLPVSSVVPCLWEAVGAGAALLQRARIQIALGLSAAAKAAASSSSAAAASSAPVPSPATIAAQVAATRAAAEAALQRARHAMAVLGMVAAADPAAVLDSPSGRDRLLKLLQPMRIPGLPVGPELLDAADALLPLRNGSGGGPDPAEVFELGICTGDYRLAKHACAALLRLESAAGTAAASKGGGALSDTGGASAAAVAAPKRGAQRAAPAPPPPADASSPAPAAPHSRSEQVGALVAAMAAMVRGDWDAGGDLDCVHWYPAAQAGLDAIFSLAPRPDVTAAELLRHMAAGSLLVRCAGPPGQEEGGLAITAPGSMSPSRLSRLFFVLGHVALKLLLHTDALAARVKALRVRTAEKGGAAAAAAVAPAPAPTAPGAKTKAGGKGGAGASSASAASAAAEASAGGIEDQLGVSGEEEEKEAALVVRITEMEVTARGLGALLSPLVEAVVTRHLEAPPLPPGPAPQEEEHASRTPPPHELLAQSALLALCKLMAVSSSTCEAHLRLIFTVLGVAPSPAVRSTITIALGDLAYRFPNLTEPYTGHLYARLRDPAPTVRRTTLMVLSHLILNDMVKIKGQVGEVAVCLHDPDTRIGDLTRLFFTELSKRGNNPIYNIFPDTLSCLSRLAAESSRLAANPAALASARAAGTATRLFDGDCFRDVMRFLLGFINKDKHAESLAEKLLHRFEVRGAGTVETAAAPPAPVVSSDTEATAEQQAEAEATAAAASSAAAVASAASAYQQQEEEAALWRDLAYCLSQLPVANEKVIRRLAEGVGAYKKCLGDPDAWESFNTMLARARKVVGGGGAKASSSSSAAAAGGRSELRDVVDEWERQLNEAHAGQAEDDSVASKARAAVRKARKVAAAEGIDSAAIAAEAAASAVQAVAAANAAEALAAGAKKGGRGRGKAAAAAPAATVGAGKRGGSAGAAKKKARQPGSKHRHEEEEEEDEGGEAEFGEEEEEAASKPAAAASAKPKARAAAPSKPPPAKRGLKAASDDDEEDDEEDSEGGGVKKGRGGGKPAAGKGGKQTGK